MTGDGEAPDGGCRRRKAQGGAARAAPASPSSACLGSPARFGHFVAEAQRNLAPLLASQAAPAPSSRLAQRRPVSGDQRLRGLRRQSTRARSRKCGFSSRSTNASMISSFRPSSATASLWTSTTSQRRRREPPERRSRQRSSKNSLARSDARSRRPLRPVASLSLAFERLMTLSDVHALGQRDTLCAAARFSLPMSGGACECLILIPQSLLLPFRKELEREETEPPHPDRRWSLSMESGVQQTRLPMTAILEELPMSLGEVADFRVGKVLPLQTVGFDSVRLDCGGRGMFLCKLGQGDGRYRLEVDLPIPQDLEQPSADRHHPSPVSLLQRMKAQADDRKRRRRRRSARSRRRIAGRASRRRQARSPDRT